jgi:hypothetical protein
MISLMVPTVANRWPAFAGRGAAGAGRVDATGGAAGCCAPRTTATIDTALASINAATNFVIVGSSLLRRRDGQPEDFLKGHASDDQAAGALADSHNRNVLPWPGRDSTVSRPPFTSTAHFAIARPSPTPVSVVCSESVRPR